MADDTVSGELRLRLLGDLTTEPGSMIVVAIGERRCAFKFSSGLASALTALIAGIDESALFALALNAGPQSGAMLRSALGKLQKQGLVSTSLFSEGEEIAACVPFGSYNPPTDYDPDTPYRLSRFAYLQPDGVDGFWLIQTPLAPAVVRLNAAGFALLGRFGRETDEQLKRLGRVLAVCGLLVAADSSEESQPPLGAWSFSNALAMALARDSRRRWQGAGVIPQLSEQNPALPQPIPNPIPLSVLPPTELGSPSMTLKELLSTRQSRREHAADPITLNQLGQFLDLSARSNPADNREDGLSQRRPYPSAGGLYPLEIYVVVNRCADLPDGIYHYAPEAHTLERWAAEPDAVRLLLEQAQEVTLGQSHSLQLLLLVTSRGAKSLAKYGSAALSLMHQDAGALTQTFYLVAENLGLAGCAVGAVEAKTVENIFHVSQWLEFPICLFWLGNRYHKKP